MVRYEFSIFSLGATLFLGADRNCDCVSLVERRSPFILSLDDWLIFDLLDFRHFSGDTGESKSFRCGRVDSILALNDVVIETIQSKRD